VTEATEATEVTEVTEVGAEEVTEMTEMTEVTEETEIKQVPPKAEDEKKKRGWIIVNQKDLDDSQMETLSYTITRILDVLRKAGFLMKVVNSQDIDVFLTNFERRSIMLKNVIHKKPDFAISRTGSTTADFYTLAVYRHLEKLDVPVMNSPEAVMRVKNKLYSLQILAQNDIPVPKTILLKFPVNTPYVVKRLGLPVVIKLLQRTHGKGVFLAKTEEELQTHIDMLESVKPDAQMIFQEFMNNSMGTDVHVLVIGGRVVGAVKRTSKGDFRSNVESQVEAYKLPATGEYIALSVVRLLDLDIARVDLLFDNEAQTRFRVCNVN